MLIEVSGSSVNAMDTMVADGVIEGRLPNQLPITLGFDVAGTVVSVGREVRNLSVGERVFGVNFSLPLHGGTWAERVSVPAAQLAPQPDTLDDLTASAIGLAGTAARRAIDAVRPGPGDTVLISGATGGVGALAVQMAKATGATVLATARSDAADFVRGLGADAAIDYTEDLGVEVRKNARDGVQCVVHLAGDAVSLAALCQPGARFASTLGVALDSIERYGLEITNVMAVPSTAALASLGEELVRGRLRVPVAGTYPLEQAARALADFPGSLGKLVISVAARRTKRPGGAL